MSNDEARQYFKDKGLTYDVLNSQSIKLLTSLLRKEIQKAKHNNKDYILENINYYRYNPKHRNICLTVKGTYFDNREAITFNNDGFIGFAGWACTGNAKPFIDGFIKWCDYLVESREVAQ